MPRRGGASIRSRSLSSGSITPMEDEDDNKPKRSTRGRNPLPPTKGPLFPPLPPKPLRPKASPHHSRGSDTSAIVLDGENDAEPGPSRLPGATKRKGRSSGTPSPQVAPEAEAEEADAEVVLDAEKPSLGSGPSLTPPPPSSDNVEVVIGDMRRGRRINGTQIDIKLEQDTGDEDDGEGVVDQEDTPKQTRATRGRLGPRASGGTTPTGSVNSDQPTSGRTSLGRRRRGEEQLLLDDHLLPEEIRRTGSLNGKRKGQGMDLVEKQELLDEEEADADEGDVADEVNEDGASELEAVEVEEPRVEVEDIADEQPSADDIIEQSIVDPDEEDADDGDGEEVTRCVCQLEDGDPLMVACDKCNVWQHGPCVGIWADEEAPDEYFCERCKPELHGPLRKWMRSKGRNIAHFTPPTPEALKALHAPGDRYPPSQSKRWLSSLPKPKAHSRSKAKEDPSPAAPEPPVDNRRHSRRGEPSVPPRAPSSHREKSAKAETTAPRRGSSHARRMSMGGSRSPHHRDSHSPTMMVNGKEKEPRKRSTMNSRDAAFEDAVQAAIEASKREMDDEGVEGEHDEVIVDEPEEGEKDKEGEKKHKGKRKREEDIDPSDPSAHAHSSLHSKSKHANQYTYRPKPTTSSSSTIPAPTITTTAPTAPSPARKAMAATPPIPQIPPPALHEHGTRRAGALATGAREAPFIAVSVTHLGWHLPDYLSGFSDIFPSPNPTPLQVRSPRILPIIPKNHFHHHKYGPFSENRESEGNRKGKLVLPMDMSEREAIGQKGETHTEPPARMKYPQRRVTTGEMRKRVRHMLDFCGRVEIEEGKRKLRKGKIGIPDAHISLEHEDEDEEVIAGPSKNGDEGEDIDMADLDHAKRSSPPPSAKPTSTSSGPTAAQLLADLTTDLRDFQDTWARGGFAATVPALPNGHSASTSGSTSAGAWNGGGYSPLPPASATFGHGSGWPTSSLGRDVIGADDGDAEEGENEAAVPPTNGTDEMIGQVEDLPDITQVGDIEPNIENETISMDVYRQGVVAEVEVVATQAEEEAAERIEDNAIRDDIIAASEIGEGGVMEAGMQDAVDLLQGVGVANVDHVDDVHTEGEDVVMAE